MALPKLDVPIYTMTLLSDNRSIRYRPFLVKEEKILYMAMEGEDPQEMTLAMKQIVNNCVQDEINVDKIPLFDLEYILLHVRAKSVSDKSMVSVECTECESQVPIQIDLTEVKPSSRPSGKRDIMLSDTVGITLNYPRIDMTSVESDNDLETLWKIVESCTEHIFDEENIYKLEDHTDEQKEEFFDTLSQEQFGLIRNFFDSIPRLQYETEYNCPNCNYSDALTIEGLGNFFD